MQSRNTFDSFDTIYSGILAEAPATSSADALATDIEKVVKKHFPKGTVKFSFSTGLGASISGRFAMRTEFTNNIIHNDPAFMQFSIRGKFDDDGQIQGKLQAELIAGGRLGKPGSGTSIKFPWRKKSGDAGVILKHFDQFFQKTKKFLEDNKELVTAV